MKNKLSQGTFFGVFWNILSIHLAYLKQNKVQGKDQIPRGIIVFHIFHFSEIKDIEKLMTFWYTFRENKFDY